jgi:integrase
MATINFYLHEPASTKATSIMLHFFHHNLKFIYSTGQKIHPNDWNKKKQRAKTTFKQASFLNEMIDKFEDEAFNGFRKALLNSDSDIKLSVRSYLDQCVKGIKKENNDVINDGFDSQYFLDYLDLMISESESGIRIQKNGKKIASATFGSYRTLRRHIIEFEKYRGKRITLILQTGMNQTQLKELKQYWLNFYAEFLDYFYTVRDLLDNTVGGNIKYFNSTWSYIRDVKIKDIGHYQQNFRVFKENIQVIALEPHHLSKLINDTVIYNSLSPTLKKMRDSFLFGCTVGLRIKDLKSLTNENLKITNDGIYVVNVSSKTNTETSIKLPQYCIEILERYKDIKRTKKLLPICADQRFNYYIKDVCKAYGFDEPIMKKREQRGKKIYLYKNPETKECYKFYELVSSHTMRRTAITSLLRLDVPERVVKSISGHCSSSKDFDRYVAYCQQFNDEKSDAAFERLLVNK